MSKNALCSISVNPIFVYLGATQGWKKDKISRAGGIIDSYSLVFIASYLRNIVQGHDFINLYSEMLPFEDYRYVLMVLLITMIKKNAKSLFLESCT